MRCKLVIQIVLLSTSALWTGCGQPGVSPGSKGGDASAPGSAPATAPAATRAQGGTDSGGGNFVLSSAEQIKLIFNGDKGFKLKEAVKSTFDSIASQVVNKGVTPKIESIFSRMLGPKYSGDPFSIAEDIDATPYELKEDGECFSTIKGEIKEAATKMNEKKSPICFSLIAVQKFPIEAVLFQLVALALHEHAHHYGFDEEDAVLAQQHALTMMQRGILNRLHFESIQSAGQIRDLSNRLLEKIDDSKEEVYPDQLICKHLSVIHGSAQRLLDLSFGVKHDFEHGMMNAAIGYEFGLSKKSFANVEKLFEVTERSLGFCGIDSVSESRTRDPIPGGKPRETSIVAM